MAGVVLACTLIALLCIDGWFKKALAAYERRTDLLAKDK